MKLLERIERSKDFWFLLITVFIFFLLRIPSLIEPYWYGDEGIYHVIGQAINQDRVLYKDIWDNKPPLLYVLYGIFSSDQFAIRLASLFFGIFATLSFWALAKKLFQLDKAVFFSTGLFAFLFAIPLLEGNIANAENFMLFPILLAGFFIYNNTLEAKKTSFSLQLFVAGLLLTIAFLFKIVAVFDLAAFSLFLIYTVKNKQALFTNTTKNIFYFFVAFALPILATGLFFYAKGAFQPFIDAALRQNIGYVGYGNTLLIPQGFLLIKLFFLFFAAAFLYLKRNLFSSREQFIFLWFLFSLFNAFFSQRPYTHYLLVLLPSFCLMTGLLFIKEKTQVSKRTLAGILFITLYILIANFSLYKKILPYYQNYFLFVTNKRSVTDYQAFFDRQTPVDYAIVSFLKRHMKENDSLFIWGNNGQVYAMLNKLPPGRFIVAYHITNSPATLEETRSAIEKAKPTFIIKAHDEPVPFHLANYKERIMIYHAHIYERAL